MIYMLEVGQANNIQGGDGQNKMKQNKTPPPNTFQLFGLNTLYLILLIHTMKLSGKTV